MSRNNTGNHDLDIKGNLISTLIRSPRSNLNFLSNILFDLRFT
jgi:hypothetical protein